MNPLRGPTSGEVLKLGQPSTGQVTIAVDPGRAGAAFAAGIQTLQPGAQIPEHKLADRDKVLFVYKGQGRATLNGQSMVVLPGAMLHVPRGAWHGLRNTGNGALQIVWMSAPPGLEVFFRELSHLGASPSSQAVQELARRHRIEFRQLGEAPAHSGAPAPAGQGLRRHRGGRHRRGREFAPANASASRSAPSSAPAAPAAEAPSPAPKASSAPAGLGERTHRRHRGGRKRTAPSQTSGAPAATAPAAGQGPKPARSGAGRQRPSQRRHHGRVEEVYMGGRWVQVAQGKPFIAPGSDQTKPRPPKSDQDDEPPNVSLSVLL